MPSEEVPTQPEPVMSRQELLQLPLLTFAQAAKILQVTRPAIYGFIKDPNSPFKDLVVYIGPKIPRIKTKAFKELYGLT